jgi:hypothetical protein
MRKYQSVLEDPFPGPGRRAIAPRLVLLAVLLLLSPVLYEAGLVVVANWQSMTGVSRTPKTPTLDAIRERCDAANREAWRFYAFHIQNGRMSPGVAVPLGVGWAAAMAMVFLRRAQ